MITANEIKAALKANKEPNATKIENALKAVKSAYIAKDNGTAKDMPADDILLKVALITLKWANQDEKTILEYIHEHWND